MQLLPCALFLLLSSGISAASLATCKDAKHMYKENDCCGKPEKTTETGGMACGDLRKLYRANKCCSSPGATLLPSNGSAPVPAPVPAIPSHSSPLPPPSPPQPSPPTTAVPMPVPAPAESSSTIGCDKIAIQGKSRYVSNAGSDSSDGSIDSPFSSLQTCVDVSGDHDACFLRAGTYHEEVVIKGKKGLTIAAYACEEVIFDGTREIKGWSLVAGTIDRYEATGQVAWQLFMDGRPLTLARYPNAASFSDEAWDHKHAKNGWLVQSTSATPNHMVDSGGATYDTVAKEYRRLAVEAVTAGHSLAGANTSFNGCPVILNTGHWDTQVSVVKNHVKGTGEFDYDDETPFTSVCCDGDGRYFIEACEAALDVEGEWTYDDDVAGRILLIPPGKANPETAKVRGKVQTYALTFDDNDDVELRGIEFFATQILMWETRNSRVLDCKFEYPSYSRRALGETNSNYKGLNDAEINLHMSTIESFQGSGVVMNTGTSPPIWIGAKWTWDCNVTFARNDISYTDGIALYFRGCGKDTIEENYFYMTGYSAAGEYGAMNGNAKEQIIRRNTFNITGGSETILVAKEHTIVELNMIVAGGQVQTDGVAIHAYKTGQNGTIYRYNWAMHSPLGGYRFDAAEDGIYGRSGTMHHNIAFNNSQYGLQVKGEEHVIQHNVGVNNGPGYVDICLARCYPTNCEFGVINTQSVLENNAGAISSKTTRYQAVDMTSAVRGNYNTVTKSMGIFDMYMGPMNGDWRPRPGGPLVGAGYSATGAIVDIGAYTSGSEEYWIPGRHTDAPQHPVPMDGYSEISPDQSLMFLAGRNAVSHEIWLAKAGAALVFQGTLRVPNNVMALPAGLEAGAVYRWQVIAVDLAGKKVPGPVWSFELLNSTGVAIYPSSDAHVYKWEPDANYGSATKIVMYKSSVRTIFFKFELGGGKDLRLKAAESMGYTLYVTGAKLRLYSVFQTPAECILWAISHTDWNEETLSYSNSIGDSSLWDGNQTQIGSIQGLPENAWVEFDIMGITDFAGSVAFAFTTEASSGATASIGFSSKEGSHPPQLVLSVGMS